MKIKKATRKELIACIQALLCRDWDCEWDGRFGKNPIEVARDILKREKSIKNQTTILNMTNEEILQKIEDIIINYNNYDPYRPYSSSDDINEIIHIIK